MSIPTRLYRTPADQIHAASKQAGKFILHVFVLEQAPPRVVSEGNQEVDIPGPRRIGQHGPEQFQFDNLPVLAKRVQLTFVNRKPLQDRHILKDNARLLGSALWFESTYAPGPESKP